MITHLLLFDPKKQNLEGISQLLRKKNSLGGLLSSHLKLIEVEKGFCVVEEQFHLQHIILRLLFLPWLVLHGQWITSSLLE